MKIKPLHTYTIITVQRPLLWLLNITLLICILLISLKLSFDYGRNTAGFDSASSDDYISQLQSQLEQSHSENIESQRLATMLKSSSRIVDDASDQVKDELAQKQDEILELKKELSFYKSIVAPEQGGRSIAIQTLQLKKNAAGDYDYKLMVSQRGRNDQHVRGTVSIRIKGIYKGKAVTYALSDVSKNVKKPLKFGFKYFQNFEGVINLPAAFQADSLHVKVNPTTGKVKAIDEQYVWSELTAAGV